MYSGGFSLHVATLHPGSKWHQRGAWNSDNPCLRCLHSRGKVAWCLISMRLGKSIHPFYSRTLGRISVANMPVLWTPAQSHVLKCHTTFSAWEVSGLSWLRSHVWGALRKISHLYKTSGKNLTQCYFSVLYLKEKHN